MRNVFALPKIDAFAALSIRASLSTQRPAFIGPGRKSAPRHFLAMFSPPMACGTP